MPRMLAILLLTASASSATCTGADPCKACKNCTACRHCAIEGQSCGVMRDQTPEQSTARDRQRARRLPKPKLGAPLAANVR